MDLETDHYLPLHRAVLTTYVEYVNIALRQKAKANELDYLNQSALLLATKHGLADIMRVLLNNDCPLISAQTRKTISIKDCIGKTSLVYAIEKDDFVGVALLLMAGGNVNTCDASKRTPLMVATVHAHKWLVRFLLKKPTLVNFPDYAGKTALHLATEKDRAQIVDLLVKGHINVNAADNEGKTALIAATQAEALWSVHRLLSCKLVRVDHTDKSGYTALYYAFKQNHTEIATVLVKRGGASLQFRCPVTHATLLMVACQHGNRDLVALCMTGGNSIEEVDRSGRNALYYACKWPSIISMLLVKYPDAEEYTDLGGKTALMRAAEIGSEALQILVDHILTKFGWLVDLDRADYGGMRALSYACYHGQCDSVRVLVAAGASLRERDVAGETPLMLATTEGHDDVVNFLLTLDADKIGLDETCKRGKTALMYAVLLDHHRLVGSLLRKGALMIPDENGVTPLMRACQRSFCEIVHRLLKHDSTNINAQGELGLTALGYACGESYNEGSVQLLLSCNADPGVLTTCGGTALHEACTIQHATESVEALLEHMNETQINQQNEDGYTALMLACENDLVEVVHLLLNSGADPFKATTGGTTPLMLAVSNDDPDHELLEILVNKMGNGNLNAVDMDGCTAIYMAASSNNWGAVLLLLDNGADATIPTEENEETILERAVNTSCLDIVTQMVMSVNNLTDRHRFVNSPTNWGHTPLHAAATNGLMHIAEFLLVHGARQYAVNNYGYTPLFYAMSAFRNKGAADMQILERVLLKSATPEEVNHVNVHGRTVLSLAIECTSTRMIDMLVAHGASLTPILANGSLWEEGDYPTDHVDIMIQMTDLLHMDVNARDSDGHTALYIMAGWDNDDLEGVDVMMHLLSRGANPWLTPDDGVLITDSCSNEVVRSLLKNAMEEPLRFQILDTARTLLHMHQRFGTISRDAKRLKSIPEPPLVLKERLLLGKKLPTYTVNSASSSPLVSEVLGEVTRLNDDIFEELFEMMRVPWNVANARVV